MPDFKPVGEKHIVLILRKRDCCRCRSRYLFLRLRMGLDDLSVVILLVLLIQVFLHLVLDFFTGFPVKTFDFRFARYRVRSDADSCFPGTVGSFSEAALAIITSGSHDYSPSRSRAINEDREMRILLPTSRM